MRFHLAITGEDDAAKDPIRRAFEGRGLEIGEEFATLAEGRQKYPTREQIADAGRFWLAKIARRSGQIGPERRIWLLDYERLADGPGVRADWMAGRLTVDQGLALYLGAARGAHAYLSGPDVEAMNPGGGVAWLMLPKLIGLDGYDEPALRFARDLLAKAQASFLVPSFRAQRRIGDGITAEAQKRRTLNGWRTLANAVGPASIMPELCPTWYGGTGAFEALGEADVEAQVAGLVEAGCTDAVIWCQGEAHAVGLVAEHCRRLAAGAARAIEPRPR